VSPATKESTKDPVVCKERKKERKRGKRKVIKRKREEKG
jgi:hypothetical protein